MNGRVLVDEPGARPLRRQLGDEAASYVRDLIMSGELRGGQFIRPEAIAETLGISATPVREGLLALRGEGFVLLEPRRGFAVAPMSANDIRDIFAAHSLLAGELAARAARRMGPDDLAGLERLQIQVETAAERGNLDELEELNWNFHRSINRLAEAPKISLLVGVVVRCVPNRLYTGWSWTPSGSEAPRSPVPRWAPTSRRPGTCWRGTMRLPEPRLEPRPMPRPLG
jgi:DNA-binding GntR family transcriptional regulator